MWSGSHTSASNTKTKLRVITSAHILTSEGIERLAVAATAIFVLLKALFIYW